MTSKEATQNVLNSDEGVATILALAVLYQGGEIRVPGSMFEEGLPPESGIRVQWDANSDELIIDIAKRGDLSE